MNRSTLRIKFVQFLINCNERLLFYPKLRSFYAGRIGGRISRNESIIVFDVGANKGQTIDFFLKINKSAIIYAFEPNPRLYHTLKNKYSLNTNIQIFNLGISNINGALELKETVTDETSSFEQLNYDSKYLKMKVNVLGVRKEEVVNKKYFVKVTRLDDFIKKEKIHKIDVLKIDTEGHELKCLEGLFPIKNCEIECIQLEKHNDDMYLNTDDVKEVPIFLDSMGYNKLTLIKHGFGGLEECIYEK